MSLTAADLQARAAAIRLLILDVDGVLTDGRIIYDDRGEEIKHFHVRDGHGIKLAEHYGITVVLITGRTSAAVAHRAADLGLQHLYQGCGTKSRS